MTRIGSWSARSASLESTRLRSERFKRCVSSAMSGSIADSRPVALRSFTAWRPSVRRESSDFSSSVCLVPARFAMRTRAERDTTVTIAAAAAARLARQEMASATVAYTAASIV